MLLQRQATAIRPQTTAHLAQTMTLLSMTSVELREKIEAALASNPALELLEERRCPTCKRKLSGSAPCPLCSRPKGSSSDEPIVFLSPREDFRILRPSAGDDMPDDNLAPLVEDLPHFVLRQIATELSPADRPLAAHILTNLDEDGLLTIQLAEIARYHHVLISKVLEVQHLIQRAEPVGVGSCSPQEALLVQLEILSESCPTPPLAAEAIQKGMPLLSRHRYQELGHLLGISSIKACEIASFISENLNPYPARAHYGDVNLTGKSPKSMGTVYQNADVIFTRLVERDEASPLVVEIALPLSGTLRVNPEFRKAIHEAPPDKAEAWKSDLEQAALLVKCLQQRNHTLVRLMQRITVIQRSYILHGDAYLIPLTRASLARELEVHESTISRAVSSKAVQLPNGHIVPMAIFFDRSLQVRTALKQIIEEEDKPLSDTEICERLAALGFPVARRTVAKYRSMEGILPAHLRKAVNIPCRQVQLLAQTK
jgi:RNA polymerase sigma-54 factor